MLRLSSIFTNFNKILFTGTAVFIAAVTIVEIELDASRIIFALLLLTVSVALFLANKDFVNCYYNKEHFIIRGIFFRMTMPEEQLLSYSIIKNPGTRHFILNFTDPINNKQLYVKFYADMFIFCKYLTIIELLDNVVLKNTRKGAEFVKEH